MNIYKLKENIVKFFDVKVNEDYIDAVSFNEKIPVELRVPTLFENGTLREFLGNNKINEASYGFSVLNPEDLREGIVIKPEREQRIDGFGRCIIKMRDPIYLANED